jgi:5-methylcytosine-specific restriction endonuclease McrA
MTPPSTVRMKSILYRMENRMALSERQLQYLAIARRGDPDECRYCQVVLTDENRTIDHVVPKSKGGGDSIKNLVLACQPCNIKKANLDLDDFLARKAPGLENVPKVVVDNA